MSTGKAWTATAIARTPDHCVVRGNSFSSLILVTSLSCDSLSYLPMVMLKRKRSTYSVPSHSESAILHVVICSERPDSPRVASLPQTHAVVRIPNMCPSRCLCHYHSLTHPPNHAHETEYVGWPTYSRVCHRMSEDLCAIALCCPLCLPRPPGHPSAILMHPLRGRLRESVCVHLFGTFLLRLGRRYED